MGSLLGSGILAAEPAFVALAYQHFNDFLFLFSRVFNQAVELFVDLRRNPYSALDAILFLPAFLSRPGCFYLFGVGFQFRNVKAVVDLVEER